MFILKRQRKLTQAEHSPQGRHAARAKQKIGKSLGKGFTGKYPSLIIFEDI